MAKINLSKAQQHAFYLYMCCEDPNMRSTIMDLCDALDMGFDFTKERMLLNPNTERMQPEDLQCELVCG